ncbi:hypothetical protein JZ751_004157 [Albula glossodonta]|uniref:Uncharacterized protein n=1 Tax=Albula glossodonta TaxID=121402 RepID=A0A8T2PH61_9TELE|nr:hypothetical protein JZ751_004157 [Albula glossodonta]
MQHCGPAFPSLGWTGLPRLPFFPENQGRGAVELGHRWPDQGNRLRWRTPHSSDLTAPRIGGHFFTYSRGNDWCISVCGREGAPEEAAGPEDRRLAPGAAGQAAVERLQRAARQDDPFSSMGQPTPSVPSLCTMATRATVTLMTAPNMQYSSSLACLTPELAELLLNHMSRERLLRPRTLDLFCGCPLQKFVLNCYPYSTNELLRQLRLFSALKHLSLVNSPLITGLSVLSSLQKLQHLNLASCSKLTDTCLQYITGLKSLSFLSLDHTKVSDMGMVKYLESAPASLTQLSLNQTAVTEATLVVLPANVPQLRLLSIKHTKVPFTEHQSHQVTPRYHLLSTSHTKVPFTEHQSHQGTVYSTLHTKVRDVSALAELLSLQTLHLDGTGVTEGSLEHLATHPALSSLSLAGIPVADGNHALQIISAHTLLHHFTWISFPALSNNEENGFTGYGNAIRQQDGWAEWVIDKAKLLTSIDLRLTQLTLPGRHAVTDVGLEFLSKLSLLSELDLTDYTHVTDQGVAQLAVMTRLKKLSLSNTLVTDEGLHCLRSLHELLELCLDRTAVTSRGVADCVTHLPHLQVLGLASTRVGDTVVRRGLVRCTQLVKLNLSRTRITDQGLKFLRQMHLSQVNLDGTGVTLSGIANLISTCPHIASIRASHTRAIPPDQVSDDDDDSLQA